MTILPNVPENIPRSGSRCPFCYAPHNYFELEQAMCYWCESILRKNGSITTEKLVASRVANILDYGPMPEGTSA